jgi:hypothetical protein
LGLSPRAGRPDTIESAFIGAFRPALAMGAALPEGFSATVNLATRKQFVRVVADDIDEDGDLDVVANVGSLDLLVWENDGAGHFSRSSSHRRESLRTQQPAPSVDGDLVAADEGMQNDDGHDLQVERPEFVIDGGPETFLFARARVVDRQTDRSLRVPRAPPLTLPL